jgi:hypothetical protein
MLIHDSELIVAAGKELRMASLNELKLAGKSARKYKASQDPNIYSTYLTRQELCRLFTHPMFNSRSAKWLSIPTENCWRSRVLSRLQ